MKEANAGAAGEGYVHGGDIYRRSVDLDYSVNINPLGMPPEVLSAAKRGVELSTAYPDWQQAALREELVTFLDRKLSDSAAWYARTKTEAFARPLRTHMDPRYITFGNGAADLIHRLMQVLRPSEVIVAAPSFSEYSSAAARAGARIHRIPLQEADDFAFTVRTEEAFLQAIANASAGDAVFLCNPNNPDGNVLQRAPLLRLSEACEKKGVYLIADECFLPFLHTEAKYTMLPYLSVLPHLVVLRAFTKIYGMPGLRLGYMLTACAALTEAVRHTMTPWEINLPAQLAGAAALQERDFTERTRELVRTERAFLVSALPTLPYVSKVYVPVTDANFILFRTEEGAPDLKALLLSQGVLLRACGNYEGLDRHFYRICVRTRKENDELLRRWRMLRN